MKLIYAEDMKEVARLLAEKGANPVIWEQVISIVDSLRDAKAGLEAQWIKLGDFWSCSYCFAKVKNEIKDYINTEDGIIDCVNNKLNYCPCCGARMKR